MGSVILSVAAMVITNMTPISTEGGFICVSEPLSLTIAIDGGYYHAANVYVSDDSVVSITTNAISTSIVTNAPVVMDLTCTRIMGTCGCSVMGCIYHSKPGPTTARIETSTVTEIATLTITWDGEPYTLKRERIIDTIVKRYKLTPSEWREVHP